MSDENKEINIDEVLNSEKAKEKVNSMIQDALNKQKEEFEKETAGIKNNKETILTEKKALEDKLKKILLETGNVDELTNRIKTERDTEWSERFNTVKTENDTLKNEISTYKTAQKISKLNTVALKELKEFNIHQASIEDAQERFAKEFDFNDAGELVHKDKKLTSEGKPFTAKDFYNELQKTKPHWFNGVAGAGVTTSQKQNSGKELTADEIKNMSRAEYAAAKKKGLIKY